MIEIPNACKEEWDKMTSIQNGKHCHVCKEVVVDFTTTSDQEIAAYLEQHGNVCGRVAIATPSEVPPYFSPFIGLKGLVVTMVNLIALTSVAQVVDHTAASTATITDIRVAETLKTQDNLKESRLLKVNIKSFSFGLSNAVLEIQDPMILVKKGMRGKYEIEIPDRYPHADLVLKVSCEGYYPLELKVNKDQTQLEVVLEQIKESPVDVRVGRIYIAPSDRIK